MTPTAELLTRVFSLLARAYWRMGCACHEDGQLCQWCERLKYDIEGILYNEPQGDRP